MILRTLLETRATIVSGYWKSDSGSAPSWLMEAFGASPSESGVSVTERTSLQLSAVWTCVNIRAGLLASLPFKVYQRMDRGKRLAREHWLYNVLHDRPSREDTSYSFRHKLAGSVLLAGNGYAEIVKDGAGRVKWLLPWAKAAVRVEVGDRRGNFRYIVNTSSGEHTVEPENMLHLRGFCFDGLEGLSVIQNHRRGLGLAVATEVFASHFYKNGARASGLLMYPGKLGVQGKQNLTESFNEKQAGLENAHKTIVLEEGVKYQQLTVAQNDAQFLETRQLSRAEIAGIFRIPTMLVPGADRTPPTYASSESFMRYILDFTLRDDLTMWQQEFNAKLFPSGEFFCEFDTRDLQRADSAARAQLHKTMWEVGAKSANDINEDENENPVTGGDRYYVPLNYVPVDRVDDALNAKQVHTDVHPRSEMVGRRLSAGYRVLFSSAVEDVRGWKDYKPESATAKFFPLLRAMADDLQPRRSDEALRSYAAALAQLVRAGSADDFGVVTDELRIYQSVDEVPGHVPAEKKQQWMEIWNKTYKQAKADGMSDADAEAKAFKYANGVIKKETQ